MTCQQFEDLFVVYLLNEAEPDERQLVEGHLGQCARCRQKFAEVCEGASYLFEIVPDAPMNERHIEQILDRARQSLRHDDEPKRLVPQTQSKPWRGWTLAAAGIASFAAGILAMVCLGSLMGQRPTEAALTPNDELYADAPIDLGDSTQGNSSILQNADQPAGPNIVRASSDVQPLGSPSSLLQQNGDPSVRLIGTSPGRRDTVQADIVAFGDVITGQIHFYGTGVPVAPPNFEYVLWLDVEGQTQAVETLDVDSEGRFQAIIALPSSEVEGSFLTLEPKAVLPMDGFGNAN